MIYVVGGVMGILAVIGAFVVGILCGMGFKKDDQQAAIKGLRMALEAARHDLATAHGLYATDVKFSKERKEAYPMFPLNFTNTLHLVDTMLEKWQ